MMRYFLVLVLGVVIGVLYMSFANEPVRAMYREEAAVVALRVLHGRDYEPPPATGEVFADMPNVDYWGTKWAEQAYRDGLFVGCGVEEGKPLFCPAFKE